MKKLVDNALTISFYSLIFVTPLILYPYTSEIFEFNKMVFVYAMTVIIAILWVAKSIAEKSIIYRRTILDIPLLIFFVSQLISSIISIDPRTSYFGYYSRFHGGLLSVLAYSIIYWAYVANMDHKKTLNSIKILLVSGILVSIYATLEHYGIDKDIWVQDVQNRVFSTLGQPNWLAAWLVALFPLTWFLALSPFVKTKQSKIYNANFYTYVGIFLLFFVALLFTKSRSGILAFAIENIIFLAGVILLIAKSKTAARKNAVFGLTLINLLVLVSIIVVGTPWTPNIAQLDKKITSFNPGVNSESIKPQGPALEVGGTDSTKIREIVWKGALTIWRAYPIFGSGVETFAFSYYNFRPQEHNLVSEWDFLYNKAHNEYLNYLANTGAVGLVSYLALLAFTILLFVKHLTVKKLQLGKSPEVFLASLAVLSGFVSILITNFFGFSVVPVALEMYLFPAFLITYQIESKKEEKTDKTETSLVVAIAVLAIIGVYLLVLIGKYWYADFMYAKGQTERKSGYLEDSFTHLQKAINLSPNEAIFQDEMAQTEGLIAIYLAENNQQDKADTFAKIALATSGNSIMLSSKNVNLLRSRANLLIKLTEVDPNYIVDAKNTLVEAIKLAPTDAKLYYNLALTQVRTGEVDTAINTLRKTIEMKSDYKDARFALALIDIENNNTDEAKAQLQFILQRIDPNDQRVKDKLAEITK